MGFVPKILIIYDFKERNSHQGAIISFGVATIGVKAFKYLSTTEY